MSRPAKKKRGRARKAALAGLGGAAILASGSQAYSAVISVTPPPDLADLGEGTVNPGPGDFDHTDWDLDGDGTIDFGFNYRNVDNPQFTWQSNIWTDGTNGVVGYVGFFLDYADNLTAGTVVDGSSTFVGTTDQVALGSEYLYTPYGGFGSVDDIVRGFVGLRFQMADGVHYGFVEIETGEGFGLTFHSAAYESEPDVGITIPEPGSLAALALGAVALLKRRR